MLVCTYLPVCPFVPLGPSHLFVYFTCFTCHVLSPSCQWGFIARWRTHLSGPCSKVFVLPNDLTTLLLTSSWTVLGDWGIHLNIACSVVNYQAASFTEPLRSSSWCVCPVVVLSWLDNLLNFFCMCLFASQVQIPAHHLPRLFSNLTKSRVRKFPLKRRLRWTSTTLSIVFWSTALASVRRPPGPPVLLRGPMWPQNF